MENLGEIERDQGAILQLTPEGSDIFDAAVADHPGIDYSCVVAGVPKPPAQQDRASPDDADPLHVTDPADAPASASAAR